MQHYYLLALKCKLHEGLQGGQDESSHSSSDLSVSHQDTTCLVASSTSCLNADAHAA